jgi:hypothetical protein
MKCPSKGYSGAVNFAQTTKSIKIYNKHGFPSGEANSSSIRILIANFGFSLVNGG